MNAKQKIRFISAIAVAVMLLVTCKKDEPSLTGESELSQPLLPSTPYSYDNKQYSSDMVTLGRVLYYDKQLSLNNSVACASCHRQENAFCDGKKFSTGLENLKTGRNSPSIFARKGRLFWDGRASSMNDLSMKPVKNHVEMRFNDLAKLSAKLATVSYYPELFKRAFGSPEIDSVKISYALTTFLENFSFSKNKFARSDAGLEKLTGAEELGRIVFFGKGRCSSCHHLVQNSFNPNQPNDSLSSNGYGSADVSFNIGLDKYYIDKGMEGITGSETHNGVFMVPVLLNVEYTAPYMHDGRFNTLEEVVEHYNSGIKDHENLSTALRQISFFDGDDKLTEDELSSLDKNRNGLIEHNEVAHIPPVKLGLNPAEKAGLVAFLRTLSDPNILIDKRFSNPFKAN